jgi:hypothetical protein
VKPYSGSVSLVNERVGPSARVRALVEPLVPTIIERAGTKGLVALAVVGSAARGEETWSGERLAGDIDLAAVVRSPNPLVHQRVERTADGLAGGLVLGCFPLYSLGRYRTIELYEAKRTAWILWGQADVFDRVRMDEPRDIPKWEALRLLLNRAMVCLEARARILPPWYAAVKTYLALGEADLVFRERYVPSYRGRWKEIEACGDVLGSRELLRRVEWAMQLKLGGAIPDGEFEVHQHERWLLEGLQQLISRYLECDVTVATGLALLSRRTTHLPHRAVHVVRHWRSPEEWFGAICQDPIFPIWERATRLLDENSHASDGELRGLLGEFQRVHQPLPR